MNWLLALIDLGVVHGLLRHEDEALIVSCFNVKGRTKGCLAAKMPNSWREEQKHAAWCALMSTINTSNVSIGTMLFNGPEWKATFHRIDDWTRVRHVAAALNQYGQHYFQFNLDKEDEDRVIAPDDFAAIVYRSIDIQLARKAYA